MCLSGRGFVVGSYLPFWYGVGGKQLSGFLYGVCGRQLFAFLVGVGFRQLCALLVGFWWKAFMCPSCGVLV
jgi:hypothetical protein